MSTATKVKVNEEIIIQSKEDALKVYNELSRAESAVKAMKKALQEYTKENGIIECKETDVIMGYFPQDPVWKFADINNLYQNLFFDKKTNPNNFLNITPVNASKLAEIWGADGMKLAGGALQERKDTFKILKAK